MDNGNWRANGVQQAQQQVKLKRKLKQQQQQLQQQGPAMVINPQLDQPKFLQQQLAAASEASSASVDSGQTALVDQHEVVWTKLQSLKEKHLQDMNEILKMLITKTQLTMPPDQLQKLNHYKEVITRMIPYLNATRTNLPKEFRLDKLEAFEKQIVVIMETFRKRKLPQEQQELQRRSKVFCGVAMDQVERQKIVKRILDTLLKHMPHSGGPDEINELLKIASRFEEKVYLMASDEQDYHLRISVKMLNLETKSQAAGAGGGGNNQSNPSAPNQPDCFVESIISLMEVLQLEQQQGLA